MGAPAAGIRQAVAGLNGKPVQRRCRCAQPQRCRRCRV